MKSTPFACVYSIRSSGEQMHGVESPTDQDLKALYGALLLPRIIEERMLHLIRQGRLSKWFSGYGQEAIAVGTTWALKDVDYILPMHRNAGVWTTRGVPLEPLFCQLFGVQGGFTKGRDRTFHFGIPEKRIIGMISHLAAMLPVACGLGLASRLKKESFVVAAFVGDGATREGDFHEAVNLAAVWRLPVIFIVENNGYGLSTPVQEAVPVENIADSRMAYGIHGEVVDGNDILKVIDAVSRAARMSREGEGPVLLEMKTFRIRGHEEASGTSYVPKTLIEQWQQKDPVQRFTDYVLREGVLSIDEIESQHTRYEKYVMDAVEFAFRQPEVQSTAERERKDVFAPSVTIPSIPAGKISEKRYLDAISDGLRQAMEQDDRVILMGQDIAEYGGVFKVTKGFVELFGKERVRNTPIIESGAVGAAIGLALEGFKPVVEMQYADFVSCAFNQIVNNLATTHYRWGSALNVTIRLPYGGNTGAGPFHSQSMESWFAHVPGLKIVAPATVEDAKGLLLAALDEPNPVLFFEHKYLYRNIRGPLDEAPFRVSIGSARVVRQGTSITVVTYGLGVHWALEEAAHQEMNGISLEVIDLRTIIPWDRETVYRSLAKTNRLLVLHEGPRTGGFGAELAASVAEEAFTLLDTPPVRVAGEDIPVPASRRLEQEVYSARSKLRNHIERLMAY